MKLAFFDNYKLGVVVGDKIVDVSSVTKGIKALGPQDVIRGVIEKWSTYKGKLAAAAKKGKGKPLAKVKLRPPLPKPENIICMAVNYMEDGTLPEPAPINAFMKSPSAVIGDGDTMVLPDMAASIFEGEAEIAVVIGKKRLARQSGGRDEIRVRLYQFHRRLGARRGAADQRVLSDEVARHVCADRPLHRHRRRDQGSAKAADHAHQQRRRLSELQHRRHGAQDSALHRMGHLDPHAASPATFWRPAPTIAASIRSWTATRSS